MKNKNFLYGLIFGFCLIPILDELVNLIVALFELPKITINEKILKGNKKLQDLQAELGLDETNTQAIGFDLSPSQEEYWDEEEFEDKIKVGFHVK